MGSVIIRAKIRGTAIMRFMIPGWQSRASECWSVVVLARFQSFTPFSTNTRLPSLDKDDSIKAYADLTHPPEGEPLIRAIAMPADANPSGDIFGGWLMSQMDLAAANAASRCSRGRCGPVAVDGMVFHQPDFIRDEV